MNATVYIRNENQAKWDAIADKSAWLNMVLQYSDDDALNAIELDKKFAEEAKANKAATTEAVPAMKMACCLAKTPCSHWMFDAVDGEYTNTLTGEVREIF